MPKKKVSELILAGFASNGGEQCVDRLQDDKGRLCVLGAYYQGGSGSPFGHLGSYDDNDWGKFSIAFREAYGISPVTLNNNMEEYPNPHDKREPFPWEHIYGMAVAAGL